MFYQKLCCYYGTYTKLTKKIKTFLWIEECQKAWELIKHKYIEALILTSPNWQVEFHVHTYASLLIVGAMMSHNVIGKSDQLIVYASRLLNKVKQNYSTTEREVLTMVFTLHKFKHYFIGNKFVFHVDHMALVYLFNKPQVSRIIAGWLLLFLKYDFTVVYKPTKTHVVTNALSRLPDITKPTCVPNQTMDASLFYIKLEWLNDVNFFLKNDRLRARY
jgi:hypothetical protein